MDSAYLGLAAADDWERNKEDYNNRLVTGLVGGAALLGAGALGLNYARSVAKNRARKAQQVNVNVEPPSGQSGTRMRDLPLLRGSDNSGGSSSPPPRKQQYSGSSQAMKDFMSDIEGGSLGPDYRPTSGPVTGENAGKTWQMNRDYYKSQQEGLDLITDPRTGEIYRAGGSQSINQVRVNQDPGVNVVKQNLGGESAPTITDNSYLASIRRSNTRLGDLTAQNAPGFAGQQDYVRNRIADSLEAPAQSAGPNVQLRDLPSATQLAKSTGTSGPKLSGYSEGPVDTQDRRHIEASRRDMPETMVEVREASAPFARDAANEARLTANDQKDLEIIKHIQRNEDVDLTRFNEDVLDRRVADARDYLIRKESDQQYNYDVENQRQAAHLADQIISELQLEGRAERDLARSQPEGAPTTITTKSGKVRTVPERYLKERSGYADTFEVPGDLRGDGELAGLKAEDNTRQRSGLQGQRSMTGEELEEVLLGESKVIESNMRGRALRGGKVNEEGNYFTKPGTVTYKDAADNWRDASTGVPTDIEYVASGPKTPEGAASIIESEAIRKQYANRRPEPLGGPAADVARSMQTLREGMSVEPSEVRPSTQVPTINRGGYADGEAVIAVPAETAFTGDAADAAGPVLFTGKNKRDSAVVGTSPPLVQETVVSNPQAAAYNESVAQDFLSRAIDSGLTEKANLTVEVYETPRFIGPSEAGPGRVPLSRSAVADPERGPDPSQRLGYARYTSESNPVGTPSTGAMTVGINYAELPQSDVYRPGDIGRVNASLSSKPRFVPSVPTPKAVMPVDAGPVRMSVPPDPQTQYAPQALAGRQATVVYPRMRGESLNPTGAMINNPDLRGGPVKFEGRERREDEYVRPISERLGRGDTMQRFPLIRRG